MDKEQSKVITKHLKEFRKIKGLSKDDVARSLGVSKNYIKELEKNQVIIDDTMLSKIIEAYRFDINQIINQEYDEEDDEYYYRVPVLGKVQCGLPIIAQDYIDTYKYLPIEYKSKGEYFYVIARGDSMIDAGIEDGDYLLMKATMQLNKYEIGCFCFDQENGVNLKTYMPSEDGDKVVLQSENEDYDDIIIEGEDLKDLRICGKLEVVEKRSYTDEDIRRLVRGR